jgi:hypothetical protein
MEAVRGDAEAEAAEQRGDQAAAGRHRARAAASRKKFGVYHAQEEILERTDARYREGRAGAAARQKAVMSKGLAWRCMPLPG